MKIREKKGFIKKSVLNEHKIIIKSIILIESLLRFFEGGNWIDQTK